MVQMKAVVNGRKIYTNIDFISHMVQMKEVVLKLANLLINAFISHMVQMKAMNFSYCLSASFALYPTWFR